MVIAIFKAGKFIDNIFIYCCLIFIYINQSNAVKALTAAGAVCQVVRNTRETLFLLIKQV
jgi:hypothetical protein